MAPAKKQQGASAAGGGTPRKKTRKEKKAENSASFEKTFRAARHAVSRALSARPEVAKSLPPATEFLNLNHEDGDDVTWSPELGAVLFKLVSTGHSMEQIAAMPGAPSTYRQLSWCTDQAHPYCDLYAKAKQQMALLLEERALAAAVIPLKAEVTTRRQTLDKDGTVKDLEDVRTEDNVARAKLMAEGFRWQLAVLQPKRYRMNETPDAAKPNDQLEALFASLKSGPVE